MNETVLVTGGTGFVGAWCVAQLLERGYRVRTTVRDLAAEGRVRAVMSGAVDSATVADRPDRLEVVAADLGADDGWAQAAGGVDVVLHVASPMAATRQEDEVVRPAVDGVVRVLRAARDWRRAPGGLHVELRRGLLRPPGAGGAVRRDELDRRLGAAR